MAGEIIHGMQHSVNDLCNAIISALKAFEKAQRKFHPLALKALRDELIEVLGPVEKARNAVLTDDFAGDCRRFCAGLVRAADLIVQAVHLFNQTDDIQQGVMNVLKAGRKICRVQEDLYAFCHEHSVIQRFFLEDQVREDSSVSDPDPLVHSNAVGIRHTGLDTDPYARGGVSMYVPETYDGSVCLPLIVALHGGFGHGRDFLWTWLREARSREFILLAPTSAGSTWSIGNPEVDSSALLWALREIMEQYSVDRKRILITGISDGATFALICGLQKYTPFTAIAPVSGVLAPVDLSYAKARRIYWVHGARDWMFPVSRAVSGCRALSASGADVTLRIIPDLAHAYPREENDAIWRLFDSTSYP